MYFFTLLVCSNMCPNIVCLRSKGEGEPKKYRTMSERFEDYGGGAEYYYQRSTEQVNLFFAIVYIHYVQNSLGTWMVSSKIHNNIKISLRKNKSSTKMLVFWPSEHWLRNNTFKKIYYLVSMKIVSNIEKLLYRDVPNLRPASVALRNESI